jgi:hypothetical protein
MLYEKVFHSVKGEDQNMNTWFAEYRMCMERDGWGSIHDMSKNFLFSAASRLALRPTPSLIQ